MLDWVGPALASITSSDRGASFEIREHPEMSSEDAPPLFRRSPLSAFQQRLARLDALEPVTGDSPEADAVWRRVAEPYAFDAFTRVRAAAAVTDDDAAPREPREATRGLLAEADAFAYQQPLRSPRSAMPRAAADPSAADVGAATHGLIEGLDLSRPCDLADLRSQVTELCDRRLLDPGAAQRIDLPSIEWFLSTDLGRLIRNNAAALRRELPINFTVSPERYGASAPIDPLDRVMIRARIDMLLLPAPDRGAILVDLKTDRVDVAAVDAHARQYHAQLIAYRGAVEALLDAKVAAAHLVFLHPQQIVTVS
jgi:ATP-dependent helicase/nuclease subunit A